MSVSEIDTAFSKVIHVGRFSLWVAIEKSNPVVHVIDGDEQNVGGILIGFFVSKNRIN